MKKLTTLVIFGASLSLSTTSQAGPPVAYVEPDPAPIMQEEVRRSSSFEFAGLSGLSYDYIEAGWALSSFDFDDLDDSNGGYLELSVSIDDNAYIKLFGSIHDEASTAGAAIGLHHELIPNLDLITDVGGVYEDLTEEFGAYTEFGARWLTCKWFELDASVGVDYLDSDLDYYGIVRAIVPVYKSLSFVASTRIEDETQTYRAGFRLNF